MSASAALAISKIFYPETETSQTRGKIIDVTSSNYVNGIDVVATGTLEGLKLTLNVGAMLVAFLGLLPMVNAILGLIGLWIRLPNLSLEEIFAYLLFPCAWLMGIPWIDCQEVKILLGKKLIFNEFVAYLDRKKLIAPEASIISERAKIISTYSPMWLF